MLSMDWFNRGVAPAYYNYPLTIRLRDPDSGTSWEIATGADVRTWLPGEIEFDPVVTVPASLPPGEYELELAMLDPYYKTPRIAWAVDGGTGDGWYSWSRITVR